MQTVSADVSLSLYLFKVTHGMKDHEKFSQHRATSFCSVFQRWQWTKSVMNTADFTRERKRCDKMIKDKRAWRRSTLMATVNGLFSLSLFFTQVVLCDLWLLCFSATEQSKRTNDGTDKHHSWLSVWSKTLISMATGLVQQLKKKQKKLYHCCWKQTVFFFLFAAI